MREILFRGKRTDNGQWVEGVYVCDPQEKNEHQIYVTHTHPCGCCLIPYSVIPETVGQYTGLKDKKGKMIFEGDILIDKYSNEKFGFVGVVKYNENLTKFQIVSDKYPNYDVGVGSRRDSIKILGNAYDNPELLEAKS